MATKRRKFKAVPGKFYYHGGMVFEADNVGKLRPRPEYGPNGRGKFRSKYYTGKKP